MVTREGASAAEALLTSANWTKIKQARKTSEGMQSTDDPDEAEGM
jgi:hypothetical protein